MHAVIGCIPGCNQLEGRHVQAGRSCSVREPEGNHNQPFAFQVDHIRAEFLRNLKTLRELIRKRRFPEFRQVLRCGLLLHDLNCAGCRDKARLREATQKDTRSKE